MLKTFVRGVEDLAIDEVPKPSPSHGEALIKVHACGICGTDVSFLRHGGMIPGERIAIGHEIAGAVESVGPGVYSLGVGDRVVVNGSAPDNGIGSGGSEGGLSDYVLLRSVERGDVAYKLPEALSFELAALVEPLAVGQRAINRAMPEASSKVCIFGAGPIGIGVLVILRDRGLEDIVVVDSSEYRRSLALKFGAAAVVDPTGDLSEVLFSQHGSRSYMGRTVSLTDVFFDAAGAPAVVPEVIKLCQRGAKLMMIAVYHGKSDVNWREVLSKELSIIPSLGHPSEFPEVLTLVSRMGERLRPLISHTFPRDEIREALSTARAAASAEKVIVRMT